MPIRDADGREYAWYILRSVEGPTREELAEALVAAAHCTETTEYNCDDCPWRNRIAGVGCSERWTAIIDRARAAGLLKGEAGQNGEQKGDDHA
jgi:hypothetical protein